MFTIQYTAVDGTSKMCDVDTKSRVRLLQYLARFDRPILAVYERSTPITKWARIALREGSTPLSTHAREFATATCPA